ncbi:hypothetical protein [Nonomuraea sp. NPDC049695]|uniref:hypothetical protein n=1 Tax=Nonomuraea sp. NPDC049695 TaxID=3154734 RepID=UPI00341E8BB3
MGGGPLARLEARVVLEELTRTVSPSYEIDQDGIRRTSHGNVRRMIRLLTAVTPA